MLGRSLSTLVALFAPALSLAQTWTVTPSPGGFTRALLEATNGDFVAIHTANPYSLVVTRLDAAGNWLGSSGDDAPALDFPRGALAAPGGGVYVFGSGAELYSRIVRFDVASQGVWQFSLGEPVDSAEGKAAIVTKDGGLAFAGVMTRDVVIGNRTSIAVARFEQDGSVRYAAEVAEGDVDEPRHLSVTEIVELVDESILLIGCDDDALSITKLDAAGAHVWTHAIGRPAGPLNVAAVSMPTGDTLITSALVLPGPTLVRIDPDGNLVWARQASVALDVAGMDRRPGGGYVLSGRLDGDPAVVALDPAANLVWAYTYEVDGTGLFRDVVSTSTGLATAMTRNSTNSNFTTLDGAGQMDGCAPAPIPLVFSDVTTDVTVNDEVTTAATTWFEGGTFQTAPLSFSLVRGCFGRPGTSYCSPAVPNSSGAPGTVRSLGSTGVAWNDLELFAEDLPPSQFGYFLAGMSSGVVTPPGAQGPLCLIGGTIHRYTDQASSTGANGAFGIVVDLTSVPGHGAILAGETWNFQAWFRDQNPVSTSNFTDALAVTFE